MEHHCEEPQGGGTLVRRGGRQDLPASGDAVQSGSTQRLGIGTHRFLTLGLAVNISLAIDAARYAVQFNTRAQFDPPLQEMLARNRLQLGVFSLQVIP